MRTLKFIVDGQIIKKDTSCDFSGLVVGCKELYAEFSFSPEWRDKKKAATFWKLGREFPVALYEKDGNICKIPAAAVTHTQFSVSVTRMEGKEFIKTDELLIEQERR